MPAFEALPGMPYWQDLATVDTTKSAYFYSKLLGWEVEGDLYRMARTQGLPVAGFIGGLDDPTMSDAWVTYFFTRDVEGVKRGVVTRGGEVLATAEVSLGTMVLCADPAGAIFGVIEPAGEDQFVAAGEPGTPVWHEYVALDRARECIDFYAELFDWEVTHSQGYYLATAEGAPFLGLRDDSGNADVAALAGFWETYFGVEDVARAARRAQELGGEVVHGPEDSPFGPLVLVADPTGATVTLCEVEAPAPEELLSESDSVLGL
ncbi:VOC family protein [Corynebacterium liangguodongii]|uniref:Glyoxalase n=1 Tax=Corynebacterium liangguodongii TaxID=2079535 RepID=A0A2S0WBK2_9CORY|nr:VOC family protein [Corynebacterium liangguodongii]AWB83148.1 glyoxalase [Corynebacterium liangguodongii]PWB98742.1 glyoxalase [Corynebacterium liangguodongii]